MYRGSELERLVKGRLGGEGEGLNSMKIMSLGRGWQGPRKGLKEGPTALS